VPPGHIVVGVGPEGYIFRPVTAEDYQVVLGVDRIRVPELLLQPTLAGVDQAGVAEIVVTLLKQMPLELRQQVVQGGLLLTGGNSAFEGEAKCRCTAAASAWECGAAICLHILCCLDALKAGGRIQPLPPCLQRRT
jgi:hypothetical protein